MRRGAPADAVAVRAVRSHPVHECHEPHHELDALPTLARGDRADSRESLRALVPGALIGAVAHHVDAAPTQPARGRQQNAAAGAGIGAGRRARESGQQGDDHHRRKRSENEAPQQPAPQLPDRGSADLPSPQHHQHLQQGSAVVRGRKTS